MVDEKNTKTNYLNSWAFSWTKKNKSSSPEKTQISFYNMWVTRINIYKYNIILQGWFGIIQTNSLLKMVPRY